VYLYLCRYLKNIANSTVCDTIAVLTVVHVTVVLNILCCCFIFCRCVLHALYICYCTLIRGVEYRDENVCLSVLLFVRISQTLCPVFSNMLCNFGLWITSYFHTHARTHTHTHTQPFNGLWSGTTRVGQ